MNTDHITCGINYFLTGFSFIEQYQRFGCLLTKDNIQIFFILIALMINPPCSDLPESYIDDPR